MMHLKKLNSWVNFIAFIGNLLLSGHDHLGERKKFRLSINWTPQLSTAQKQMHYRTFVSTTWLNHCPIRPYEFRCRQMLFGVKMANAICQSIDWIFFRFTINFYCLLHFNFTWMHEKRIKINLIALKVKINVGLAPGTQLQYAQSIRTKVHIKFSSEYLYFICLKLSA